MPSGSEFLGELIRGRPKAEALRFLLDQRYTPESGILAVFSDALGLCVLIDPARIQSAGIQLPGQGGPGFTRNLLVSGRAISSFAGHVVAGADLDPGAAAYLYSDGSIGINSGIYPFPVPRAGVTQLYCRYDTAHELRAIFPLTIPPQADNAAALDLPFRMGPEDASLLGLNVQTINPTNATGAFVADDGGDVYLAKFLARKTALASAIYHLVTTAGATLANCFAGIYSASGTLLGATANIATNWQSTGNKAPAIATPFYMFAGTTYYFALLVGSAATPPQFAGTTVPLATVTIPQGATAAGSRLFQVLQGTATALPASITMASTVEIANESIPWMGA